MPEHLPLLSKKTLLSWTKLELPQIAGEILQLFSGISIETCKEMTARAFSKFNDGKSPPLPLKTVGDRVLLETGNGPTFAFKDIGQQVNVSLGCCGE